MIVEVVIVVLDLLISLLVVIEKVFQIRREVRSCDTEDGEKGE